MIFKFPSMLDDDLYKFTMQQAILKQYPNAQAKYKFINRGPQRFNDAFLGLLKDSIKNMSKLHLTLDEKNWLSKFNFISPWYIDFLFTYRYNPKEVSVKLDSNYNLELEISAPWYRGVLWEVKLMALISELYFQLIDTNWSKETFASPGEKRNKLTSNSCKFADFGTRRRRAFWVQEYANKSLKFSDCFVGTSNVHLAHKFGIRPIGTMAHEWIQAISVLESLNHPNRFMLQKWAEVYEGSLGIALTDTYGSNSFFKDFNTRFSKLFDGVRHDSACPFEFTDKTVAHYIRNNISPSIKTIVFSDGLNVDRCVEINKYCKKKKIGCSFGIGTNFTNDFKDSPALNMVIKLNSINDKNVVKLSDDAGKETGDHETIEMMKKIHGRS